MRLRRRVIRTRSSRPDAAGAGAGSSSFGALASSAGRDEAAPCTSALVTLPFGPVPRTVLSSTPASSASLRAAGPMPVVSAGAAPFLAGFASSASFDAFAFSGAASASVSFAFSPSFAFSGGLSASGASAFSAGASVSALPLGAEAFSSIVPKIAPTSTSLPSSAATSCRTPAAGGRDFEADLVGLQLDQRLVRLDAVTGLLQPLGDRRLGDRFTERGYLDLDAHTGAPCFVTVGGSCTSAWPKPSAVATNPFCSFWCWAKNPVAGDAAALRPA